MSGKCLWWYHVLVGPVAVVSSAERGSKFRGWNLGANIKGIRWHARYRVGLCVYIGRISISFSLWIPWPQRKEAP